MPRHAPKPASALAAAILEHVAAGRFAPAVAALGRLPRTDSGHDAAWLALAKAQYRGGDPAAAGRSYRRLLHVNPRCAQALHELGAVLLETGEVAEAIDCLLAGNKLNPNFAPAYNNLGIAYRYQNKMAASRSHFDQALALQPDFPSAAGNKGMTMLAEGNFDGFALYENRLKKEVPGGPVREGGVPILPGLHDKLRWDGGDLHGKHLVVWAEQGMGDNLMMMRYLPLLRARGCAKLTVLCHPSLAQAMGAMADAVLINPDHIDDYAFDCYCPSMSLPYCFGTRLETIPAEVPYLQVPAALAQPWAGCLARLPGLKVGLVWAGGPTFKRDTLRSMVLRQVAPLMAVDGVHWISLQKGQASEDLADVDWRILDWAYHCDDLMDTAALIKQLDLVISVDTSVAHLAGALGKPVWLLSRYEGEWRWLAGRSDSPWYPSMRIFQQPGPGDWDGVLADVRQALAPLAAQAGATVPLSAQQWAACVRDCAAGPVRKARQGFLARWFGGGS